MERPRILVIGPTPPPYQGGAVATRALLDSDLARRFELVHLETADRRSAENSGRFDLTNVRLALQHGLLFLWLLLRRRPHVVYVPVAQNTLGFLRDALFLVPARLLRKRIVVHVHGGYFGRFVAESGWLTRAMIRWTFRGVDRGIVLGERLRGMFAGVLDPARVEVVPNGLPDLAAGASPRTRPGRTVLYLGTLMEGKGFLELLEAAKLLNGNTSPVRFVFAGDFHLPSDRERAAAFGTLDGRVEYVGVVAGEAKARLLNEADLLAFPTHYPYEGHPLVIVEAMAAGLPVISTDHGAIAETVVDGVTGRLVPKHDPRALAAAIAELLADDERRRAMGQAGRARYEERYTLERWAARLGGVFERAMEAAG